MGLETGTTIGDLNENWPLGSDLLSLGDDHIRLVKSVLKATFAGLDDQTLDAILALYLPLAGGVLTGDLTLANEPTQDLHAATKKYADDLLTGGFKIAMAGVIDGASGSVDAGAGFSVTVDDVGEYTVTFDAALADANYSVFLDASNFPGGDGGVYVRTFATLNHVRAAKATTGFAFDVVDTAALPRTADDISLMVVPA